MKFSEILKMALQNLRANRLRAVLTLMIIAFGIMALVGILTAIDALSASLTEGFSGLGANSFSINQKWGDVKSNRRGRRVKEGEPISYNQAIMFKERFNFPAKVSVSFWAGDGHTVKWADKKTNPNIPMFGTGENYLTAKGFEVEFGRAFSDAEINDGRHVCLLGADVAKKLFERNVEKAIGQDVSVDNQRFRVVGVLKSKGSGMNSGEDRRVLGTLDAVKADFGGNNSNFDILIAVKDATTMDAAEGETAGLFRQIRGLKPGQEDDFEFEKNNSIAETLKENTVALRAATVAIGLMTLLGAAIGLMNIMLVSVTERTKEIGIIKALGATRRTIMIQFLLEAIVICLMGGVVGVVLGILMGNVVTLIFHGAFYIPWVWMLMGFTLCFIVGIISGLYPALKASRLDPIEALRYE
jgi:putative ABC transport system permease protein